MTEPEPARRAVIRGPRQLDDRVGRGLIFHVDRQLEGHTQLGVEVCQAGHLEPGELVGGRGGDVAAAYPPPDHPVVRQHDLAVGGQPGVGLEAAGALLEGTPERGQRVLGRLGPGATVGEGDRWHGPRHYRASWAGTCAKAVAALGTRITSAIGFAWPSGLPSAPGYWPRKDPDCRKSARSRSS